MPLILIWGVLYLKKNLIINSKDDGIDCGTVDEMIIQNNLILKSGDKGISVGEKSYVLVKNNIIKNGNIGIAVKDGSKAKFTNNIITENKVGLSVYEKYDILDSNPNISISGDSWIGYNDINYKFGMSKKDLNNSGITNLIHNSESKNKLENQIYNNCEICKKWSVYDQ